MKLKIQNSATGAHYFLLILCLVLPFTTMAQQLSQKSFRNVNSAYDEQAPVITPDGKMMYWTVANHPDNVGGKKDPGDIWYSVWTGEEWSFPQQGDKTINDEGYNAVVGFSNDGERIFLVNHYRKNPADLLSQGISVSLRTPEGWSKPENINIPYFLNRSTTQGFLSTAVEAFVFSANSYSTVGGEDIYVSILESGKWSEPKNLGKKINSVAQEFSPSLSADGKHLYFSSNGRKGYGSSDVYYSERLDDTWTNWSDPVNMGANVNSEGRELFYRAYPGQNFALFTSTHNSDGYGDIRFYKPPIDLKDSLIQQRPDTIVKMIEIVREKPIAGNEKLFQVYGKVTNLKTGLPLRATLTFHSDSLFTTLAGPDGKYKIVFPSVNEYSIRVECAGYVGNFEKLDVRTYEMKTLEMNFKLQPIEIGATVNLKSVLFQQSTYNLLPESNDELDLVVSLLKTNPKVEIQLSGHTDNRGNPEHNQRLSQKRVERVKGYIVSKGISTKRVSGKGFGGSKPMASNDSEETRRLNRRVEFTIVKD
ncbi:MAG: OmpA family protein [Cyclobacteriaceae bacterium]|nr:OmpA family protein [Cyclobacteriaceae bacterium]